MRANAALMRNKPKNSKDAFYQAMLTRDPRFDVCIFGKSMRNHFQKRAKEIMKHDHSWFYRTMNSPLGELMLVANEESLVAILWQGYQPRWMRSAKLALNLDHPILLQAEEQLREYFDGKRSRFDLPLMLDGTPFQVKVWQELQQIPFGQTRSYRELAIRVGSPKACRAVGAANGRNPLGIVVPCHRVVGANGGLTGFAGGMKAKKFLLDHEKGDGTSRWTLLKSR